MLNKKIAESIFLERGSKYIMLELERILESSELPFAQPLDFLCYTSVELIKIAYFSRPIYLTYEAADQVVKAGLGISTAIGIGGDPIIGTSTKQAVELFMNDPETEGIVMIGEIGGNYEAEAARWVQAQGNPKPVVGFIAGQTAPKGKRMGHAGAIIGGADDTAAAKMKIMRECGLHVVESPADIGETMAKVLG